MGTAPIFYCPASGCGRKTRLRADGTIGSHTWAGATRCAAYGKTPGQAAQISATGGPRPVLHWATK